MSKTKKSILYFLISTLFLITVAFGFSPWLVKSVIQQQLPAGISLEKFDMEYPSWNQLSINEVVLRQTSLSGSENTLQLEQLSITSEWPWRKIEKISLESVTGKINFFPTFETAKDKNEEAPVLFELPDAEITQFRVELLAQTNSPLLIEGSLTQLHSVPRLAIQVSSKNTSDKPTRATVTVLRTANDRFEIEATALMDLNQWEKIRFNQQRLPILPFQFTHGKIELALDSSLSFAEGRFNIVNLVSSLNILGASMRTDEIQISDLNGVVEASCVALNCNFTPFKISGRTELINPMAKLTKTEFPFLLSVENARGDGKRAEAMGKLTIDQNQSVDFHTIASRQNSQWSFNNELSLMIKHLDETWHSSLEDLSIDLIRVNASVVTTLENGVFSFSPPLTKNLVLQGIQYNYDFPISISEVQIDLVWKNDFLKARMPIEKITINTEKILVDLSTYNSEFVSSLNAQLKDEKEHLVFSGKLSRVSPSIESEKSIITSTSEITGTFLHRSKKIKAQVVTNTEISNIKSLLKSLTKKNEKLIDALVIESTPDSKIYDKVSVDGELNLKVSQDKEVLLNGKLRTNIAKLGLADYQLSDFLSEIKWSRNDNEYQSWSRFYFDLKSQLDFKEIDEQTHHLSGIANIKDQILFEKIQLNSQILGGQLTANANDAPGAIGESDGELKLSGIDLKKLNRLIDKQELEMSGQLSGNIPFFMQEGNLRFSKGELKSDRGVIEYIPDGEKKTLTQENISDIASLALQNFHYKTLNAKVLSGGPCGFDIKFRLEGRNPELGLAKDQVFNINYAPISNVNLYYLLLLGEDSIKELDSAQLHSGCVNSQ